MGSSSVQFSQRYNPDILRPSYGLSIAGKQECMKMKPSDIRLQLLSTNSRIEFPYALGLTGNCSFIVNLQILTRSGIGCPEPVGVKFMSQELEFQTTIFIALPFKVI